VLIRRDGWFSPVLFESGGDANRIDEPDSYGWRLIAHAGDSELSGMFRPSPKVRPPVASLPWRMIAAPMDYAAFVAGLLQFLLPIAQWRGAQ
jgi:hypothetical protein